MGGEVKRKGLSCTVHSWELLSIPDGTGGIITYYKSYQQKNYRYIVQRGEEVIEPDIHLLIL